MKIEHNICEKHRPGDRIGIKCGHEVRKGWCNANADITVSVYDCEGLLCDISEELDDCNGQFCYLIPALCSGVYRFCIDAYTEGHCHDDEAKIVQLVVCEVEIDSAKITTMHEPYLPCESPEGFLPELPADEISAEQPEEIDEENPQLSPVETVED